MTGTLPAGPAASRHRVVHDAPDRARRAVRPWSALVCGLPDDRTLLVVDWLLLACRAQGLVAHAIPLAGRDGAPHGMYVEVAGSLDVEACLSDMSWSTVDLLVAGEHLELARAIEQGFADPATTTIVASCRRDYTDVEQVVAPQHVVDEREIDRVAQARSRAYHAFDGAEVASWYSLPASAQPGLLFGAICASGAVRLDADACRDAIAALGIDASLQLDAFTRGQRLGRRRGGRVRRARTAYQFTRRRRALVEHRSRVAFEQLVQRAEDLVPVEHLPTLQAAIFQLVLFQDAEWAGRMVAHVESIALAERELLERDGRSPDDVESLLGDAIRSLAALMTWPDLAWVASRKRRDGRMKEIRAARGVTRSTPYELVDHVVVDPDELAQGRRSLPGSSSDDTGPAVLRRQRTMAVRTTSVSGAMWLRRAAAGAQRRPGSARQQLELDTTETWLQAVHDALRVDHDLARIVARSGTMVQGGGAVRDATRATALAFWGRVVRPSLAIDRHTEGSELALSRMLVPFTWDELCRSGPLALWEHSAHVLSIALAHSRGAPYAAAIQSARALVERRP